MKLGAIILTGGASSRMGEDKAACLWLGVRAIDRVARLAKAMGAGLAFSVGRHGYGLPFVADSAPLGGPVGGILAGGLALTRAGYDLMLVLAVDAPTLRADDLAPLLDLGSPGAAYAGYHLPMVLALHTLPADARANWPVSRLLERCALQRPDAPATSADRLRGANTPAERDALMQALAAYETAGL